MRLIDVEEAYKVLTDYYHHGTEIQHKALKEAIERVPTVDIDAITESHERIGYDRGFRDGYAQATSEVKHGHWKSSQGLAEVGEVQCSNCKTIYYAGDLYNVGETDENGIGQALMPNYCPHCGAYMEAKDGAERK